MTKPFDSACRQRLADILENTPDLTIATLRADGWPQATVVSFVHDGPIIYFGVGADSQKAENIARDNRVSITVTPPYEDWMQICGVSMAARAIAVTDEAEQARAGELMFKRFPEAEELGEAMNMAPGDMTLFRVAPEVVSFLDYTKGFGHTELYRVDAPLAA
ncbi:MAG: pyridoxamine 5'-phosphate oxidase family protein [Hyphococcus sp.]